MDYDLTTQYLYNDITITAPAVSGGAQNAQDAASIAKYGKRSLAITFAYMGTDQALPMAKTLLLAYREPHPRIHALTIDVDATTGVTQSGNTAADQLFAIELTSRATVVKRQPGNLSLNRVMTVQGIKHDIKPNYGGTGIMHEIQLLMTEATEISPLWTLGLSQLGISTYFVVNKPLFDPTTISGCTLYLRGDRGVTLSGGTNVVSWADQSGNGNTATAVTAPTFASGAITFNGPLAQYMTLAANPLPLHWSVFVVAAADATLIASRSADSTKYRRLTASPFQTIAHDTDGTAFANVTDLTTTSTFAIHSATSAAGQPIIVYRNNDGGVSFTASTAITDYATTNWQIGLFNSAPEGGDSTILAILAYNRVLTPTERATVLDGLNNQYLIY
jgi:hypothetical protein